MRNLLAVLCLAAIPSLGAEIYTFTVSEPVTVTALPGTVTGWGYTLHNESSLFWLVTTGLSAGTFQHATPDLIFDFPFVAPGATITVPYEPAVNLGLYQILWDSNAPAGFVNSGTFDLTAEWYSDDPFLGGNYVSDAATSSQPYRAELTSAVPEPGTFGLAASICPLCASHDGSADERICLAKANQSLTRPGQCYRSRGQHKGAGLWITDRISSDPLYERVLHV